MFPRKKTQDFQTSLQRFADLSKDIASRAKHFAICFEGLNQQEKRHLIENFSFEIFHLIDSLLLSHYDLPIEQQTINDVESALGMLEQVLIHAPELVGRGWQRNGTEFLLKLVLHPRNVLVVRKLAIRLFIVWYQSLAIFSNASSSLDSVFQCLLPHFPLRNGQLTEQILTVYCEGGQDMPASSVLSSGFEPCAAKAIPVVMSSNEEPSLRPPAAIPKVGTRERAQDLQAYLDKFLDYVVKETMRINWADPSHRLECAKFMIDRIIAFYIYEVFPEAEANGVDVFGGWEGTFEDENQLLDATNPIVIARYWLIRWLANIVIGNAQSKSPLPGLQLFKQALYSSQKATNMLLTLVRESFRLPLPCINVIQKILHLLRSWLSQTEIPQFVESGLVSLEGWTLLLVHMLFSFFRSPCLRSTGDKLASATAIAHSILQIVRDLANPSCTFLSRPLSKVVWQELLRELIASANISITRSDAFGQAIAGGFARTLLTVLIFVRIIREVEVDERIWDEILAVFRSGDRSLIVDQWAGVVDSLTRALLLNLFGIDVASKKEIDSTLPDNGVVSHQSKSIETSSSNGSRRRQRSRTEQSSDSSSFGLLPDSAFAGHKVDDDGYFVGDTGGEGGLQGVVQATGNVTVWLRTWMRVISLVDPAAEVRHSQQAVQTYGRAIDALVQIGCAHSLVHWLSAHILRLNVAEQPHAIPVICNVLSSANPLFLERAYILYHLLNCLRHEETASLVLEHVVLMRNLEDMAIISADTILTLQKLIKNSEFSSRAIRVTALLALNHPEAEKILVTLIEQRHIQIDQFSLTLCVNALSLLILERADAPLFDHLLNLLVNHQFASHILPIFCANLNLVIRLGFYSQLVDAILLAQSRVKNLNSLNDLKWQFCALVQKESLSSNWRSLSELFSATNDEFFEGFVFLLGGQFPLPGFHITQWNSLPAQQQQMMQLQDSTFIETSGAILSFDKNDGQTLWCRNNLGRHCYRIEEIVKEETDEVQVENWLRALANTDETVFQSGNSARKKSSPLTGETDIFKELPNPSRMRTYSPPSCSNLAQKIELPPTDISVPEMLQFLQNNSRCLEDEEESEEMKGFYSSGADVNDECGGQSKEGNNFGWRQFISSFGLLEKAKCPPANFHRDIRHLDSTPSREVHKVAVIYVGRDQQDKQTILSNKNGSDTFAKFVDGLGWMVQIGSPLFHGYTGGLPNGQIAPYYANGNTELVFHVSTLLNGDNTQRLKHLGNDEVHVIWSENTKPYRRDLIATRFCDVLIVLYLVSPVLLRVHIEIQDHRIHFGPLFDGACIHVLQAASLVRETVLNASRAYRNIRLECDRPNKHREKVFRETKQMLKHLPLSTAITRLYGPLMD